MERPNRASTNKSAPYPAYAITKAQEKELGLNGGKGLAKWSEWDAPTCTVHVMSYELGSMKDAAIDPISAILTLSEVQMEHPLVEEALTKTLKKVLTSR